MHIDCNTLRMPASLLQHCNGLVANDICLVLVWSQAHSSLVVQGTEVFSRFDRVLSVGLSLRSIHCGTRFQAHYALKARGLTIKTWRHSLC